MFKMYLISAERYKHAKVDFLTMKKTSEIWVNMKEVMSWLLILNDVEEKKQEV